MSTVDGDDFNGKYGGDIGKLAGAFSNTIAIYSYREPWNGTLCYKVLNSKQEEEAFLLESLEDKKRVWP